MLTCLHFSAAFERTPYSCRCYSKLKGILSYLQPNPRGIAFVWPALLPLCCLCWPGILHEVVHFCNRCGWDLWQKWPFRTRHSIHWSKIFQQYHTIFTKTMRAHGCLLYTRLLKLFEGLIFVGLVSVDCTSTKNNLCVRGSRRLCIILNSVPSRAVLLNINSRTVPWLVMLFPTHANQLKRGKGEGSGQGMVLLLLHSA